MNELRLAQYTDNRDVVRSLRQTVTNGQNPEIVTNHMVLYKEQLSDNHNLL